MEPEESNWTWIEDKVFENSLLEFPEGFPNRWEIIAAMLPEKSPADIERHYIALLIDVTAIDAGMIDLPEYEEMEVPLRQVCQKNPKSGVQRKGGKPWTVEEHRRFLQGLEKYGKGDWKSISRYALKTRNPTQVASHAQKYFEHQQKEEANKKRRSIFYSSIPE